jgi:hypothetical protein
VRVALIAVRTLWELVLKVSRHTFGEEKYVKMHKMSMVVTKNQKTLIYCMLSFHE